jgi:hypothetical protein
MAAGDVAVSLTQIRAFNCNVFDGVDDYVEIPHNAAQLGANLTNGFTISAWINARSYGEGGNTGMILDKSSAAGGVNGFRYCLNSAAGTIEFKLNNGTARLSAASSVIFGSWLHILVTITSGQLANHYVNGVLSGTANQDLVQTIATITTTNAMRIGNRTGATDKTFDGGIRSVKMWNRVLTATEIANDYAGLPNTTGLIHHFKLGGDYTDYGSVGVTATNSGSAVLTVEDQVAAAIKAQRTTTGATGKFYITKGKEGQVLTAAISE